jgi:hypothetical protein
MSWNGSGSFSRLFSWVADKTAGLDISSSRMDTDSNDIASNGFGNCLTRDGQGSATGNLPMNNFKHTGVGNGSARTDSVALGQVQDGNLNWVAAGGTADALTATYSPAVTTLVDGQLFFVRASAPNATTTPTFAPNGLTPRTITKGGGAALAVSDIPFNLAEIVLRYNLANTRYELLNPALPPLPAASIPNVVLAPVAAWTLKGNKTNASATPQDFTIDALTVKTTPLAADEVPIWDAAGTAMKKATLQALATAVASGFSAPTVQRFTSGSGTYTPTAGTVRIRVRMVGGGGGGGCTDGAAGGTNGTAGATTTFGSWTALAGGGALRGIAGAGGTGGSGGTGGANGTGTLIVRLGGGAGGSGTENSGTSSTSSSFGGANSFGGAGAQGGTGSPNGGAGTANTGAGGGGGSSLSFAVTAGGGGGAGEYVEFYVTAPAAISYAVGGAGAGGTGGSVSQGGNGAAGIIVIEEFYI